MGHNEMVGYLFDGADGARFELVNAPYQNEKGVTYLIVRSGEKRVTQKFAGLGIKDMRRLQAELQKRIDQYYGDPLRETWRVFNHKARAYVLDDVARDQPMRFDRIEDAQAYATKLADNGVWDAEPSNYFLLHRFLGDKFTGDSVVI